MRINQQEANDLKERMLSMCTHDCGAFLKFRSVLEGDHALHNAAELEDLVIKMNKLLRLCGAGTNGDY